MVAWAVKTARGFVALFLDRARAAQYACSSHGVIIELVGEETPQEQPTDAIPDGPDRT